MNRIRVIKKYSNRKLYDVDTSTYVNLSDIKEMILQNQSVKIIDHTSGVDITNLTLKTACFELSNMPDNVLLDLIKKYE